MKSPKVGICGWILAPLSSEHVLKTGFEEMLKAAELGFKGIELIVSTERQLKEFYTRDNIKKILEICETKGLTISQFVILSELIEGLASMDNTQKQNALKVFREGVNIAKELNVKIVNTVSQWPKIEAPFWYVPIYIHPVQADFARSDFKLTIKLPDEVKTWDKYWENYVDSIGQCTDIAADAGLYFSLEVHPHSIVSTTDALLLLFKEVGSNKLGANMDTGWHFTKREYIPLSIYRLRDRLLNMHVRDSDGFLQYNLPPGMGILNWVEILRALKDIGYEGFMDFEFVAPGCEDFEDYLRRGKKYLEEMIEQIY